MKDPKRSASARLQGRNALVTGAGGDIGAAIAVALGERGANLILLGRSEARLRETGARVRSLEGATVETRVADLGDDGQIKDLADMLIARGASLDILVHCASAYDRGKIATASIEQFDRQHRVNLRAPYRLAQLLTPLLCQTGGDVVFINSSQGTAAGPDVGAYAATQHGRAALAETLRAEINDAGVRVLSVFLGRTAGRRQQEIYAAEGRPYMPEQLMQPEDVAEMVAAALCLSRRAEVMSIAIRPALKSY
jgi:short-subunit dehydrogenase